MGIQPIGEYLTSREVAQATRQQRNFAPQFKGAERLAQQTIKEATNVRAVSKHLPPFLRFTDWLGINSGELLNNTVTAAGTAAVAPIFIVNNPLSKEDKNSRKYSAWRQPISAVITFTILNKINSTWNKFFDKMAMSGTMNRIDLSHCPPANYYEAQIQANYKTAQIKYISNPADSPYKDEFPNYKEFKEKELSKLQKEYQQPIMERAKKTKTYRNHDLRNINVVDLVADADTKIKKLDTISEILKELNVPEKDIADYVENFKNNDVLKTDKKMFQKYNISFEKMEEILDKKLQQAGINTPEPKSKKVQHRFANKLNIFGEERAKNEIIPDLKSQARKAATTAKATKTRIFNEYKEKLNRIIDNRAEKTPKQIKKEIQMLKKTTREEFGKIITNSDEILENLKIEKWFKAQASKALNVYKNTKTLLGIIVGIGATLVTCPILNWVYPRFMNEFLPHLAKAKAEKNHPQPSPEHQSGGKEVK